MKKDKLFAIIGQTATGKSNLAIKLAKKVNGEIISMDSMQIYKGMDIGTAKIKEAEMDGILHHMIDVVSPNEQFSVYDYTKMTEEIIKNINKNNKIPILVGGTGLYFESLIYSYSFASSDTRDESDDKIREELTKELKLIGNQAFYEKLCKADPNEAKKIHPNNTKRMIRAMEIYIKTGSIKKELANEKVIKYDLRAVELTIERQELLNRISARVNKMFDDGLKEEVQNLLNKGINFSMQSMLAIGYREFKDYFDNKISIKEVKDLIIKHTKEYAKRQRTWFRRYDFIKKIDCINQTDECFNYFGA